jgi:arginyl-tRNA synthetase
MRPPCPACVPVKDLIRGLVVQSLADLQASGKLTLGAPVSFTVERTRDKSHGDFACNVAMQAARVAGRKPREIAELVVAALPAHVDVSEVAIAGPGFINFRLSPDCLTRTVLRVLDADQRYGFAPAGSRPSIIIEYVSANPNGPLHVGHGRGASYGATLANLLEAGGHTVFREYYVNDAGRQMDILAVSVWLRYLELGNAAVRFPDNGYKGDYVHGIARDLRLQIGAKLHHPADVVAAELPPDETQGGSKELHVDALIARAKSLLGDDDYRLLFESGLKSCLADIKDDLAEFGVSYDNWFSERSLSTSGAVKHAIETLQAKGHMYEKDGAQWFRATDFGDEKDRVVVRENGATTYFASDIAYLQNKLERGFDKAVYVLGADHHGYIARLKAVAQGLGLDPDKIEIPLVQFAILYEGGQRVQMSTRAGSFVTLRDLRKEVGKDAARFFYVMRSNEQHLDFDLDLAKSQSVENPVYYLQYTHARICGLFRQAVEKNLAYDEALGRSAIASLVEPAAVELLQRLMNYPEDVETAVENRAPHLIAAALREIAALYNSFYNGTIMLVESGSDRCARLALADAVRRLLASGLELLGVSAPETM